MKTAVIYATKTKHSKKLAEAIGLSLNIQAHNITEKPTLNDVDLLFIVGGIYGGVSGPELLEFLKNIDAPLLKNAAIVTNCCSGSQKQNVVRNILEEKGVTVLEEFICKGNFLFFSFGHPNTKDLKDAVDFAQKIVSVVENQKVVKAKNDKKKN